MAPQPNQPEMLFGPLGNVVYDISPRFSQFLIRQNKYQMNLSVWKQYIIWKYTIDSAPITAFLLEKLPPTPGLKTDATDWVRVANNWTYYFFKEYDMRLYGKKNIESPFRKWLSYFENSKRYNRLSKSKQFEISKDVIKQFQLLLKRIITSAPKTPEILYLYKASTLYSGIPLQKGNLASHKSFKSPVVLEQKPFNSATFNPRLDFDSFMERNKKCCMFEIKIPKGVSVLAISSYIHAHPDEKEVLLLPEVDFEIVRTKRIGMTFIPGGVPTIKVQSSPYHIGPIVEEDLPSSKSKGKWYELTLFETNLVS